MTGNPNCFSSCELNCDLGATKAAIAAELAAQGSPVQGAKLSLEIAKHEDGEVRIDAELDNLLGRTDFDDPGQALREAQSRLAASEQLTASYGPLSSARTDESRFLGKKAILAIDGMQMELSENRPFCPGPKRGFVIPGIGFLALGFGPSTRCGSPVAPLIRSRLKNIS